jgi:hypothetical protein
VITLPELQSCLDSLGVKVSLRLVVDAPAGAITAELRDALAEHKHALMARLVEAGPPEAPVPEAAAPGPPPWPPRDPRLAGWPVEWREKWGIRANELEAAGVPWPEHERRAFLEVQAEMTGPPPPDPERHRRIRERFATWVEDEYAKEERAAIQEFDGGLSREAAERKAGLRPPRYEDID